MVFSVKLRKEKEEGVSENIYGNIRILILLYIYPLCAF
jgi:hypothetical protein